MTRPPAPRTSDGAPRKTKKPAWVIDKERARRASAAETVWLFGLHAVRDALAYGVKVTGTTVHYIDAGVDTGEIIAQKAVEVRDGETEAELHERIKVHERALIVDVLRRAHIDNENDGKVSVSWHRTTSRSSVR